MSNKYRFVITVNTKDNQGAIEASDRVAKACSAIQEHDLVQSVRYQSDAPDDFRSVKVVE